MALLLILRGVILISLLCVPSGLWVSVLSNFSLSPEDSWCKEIDEQQSAEEQSLSMGSD